MEKDFWLEKWKQQQIGFHKNEYNQNLVNYISYLNLKKTDHVLVPLCGKSLDMIWLKDQGYQVTGVELSEIAIVDFFEQNNLEFFVEKSSRFNRYIGDGITILEGDIFDLKKEDVPGLNAIYDRAATIALPDKMRAAYLKTLTKLTDKPNILMVLLEYDQNLVAGPPFSVSQDFIQTQFVDLKLDFKINKLGEKQVIDLSQTFHDANASVLEKVYHIFSPA